MALLTAAVAFSVAGILIALLVAVLVYAVGIHLLHAAPQVVGLVAFIVFVLLLLGNVGAG